MGEDPFDHIAHRPWPLPGEPWVMRQRWEDLLFAHWPCSTADLRDGIPKTLEIDTFDGDAWIGIVPFRMSNVGLRALPGLPGATAFPELNVRTYVRRDDRPGVWFFSLDAASAMAVRLARTFFRLPYFDAEMHVRTEGERVRYSSGRTHRGAPDASFDARYGPSGDVSLAVPGTLDHWLTERYCLYAGSETRLLRAEIHHRPWPLQPAWAEISHNTMAAAAGIALPTSAPRLHFARRIDVRAWRPRIVA